MTDETNYYEPSSDDIQRVIAEVLDAAADGVDPMFPIEQLGQCYFVDIGGGRDTDMHPWTFGIGRFFVDDEGGRIHWMHPDIRTVLDRVTPELLREAIMTGDGSTTGRTPEELAQKFYQWCRSHLTKLDKRMERATPFYQAAAQIGRYASPALAHEAFESLCAQHGIAIGLGRNIARCALRLDFCGYVGMDQPTTRAALLSRMIDTRHCPAPAAPKARDALARLHLAEAWGDADDADIDCVAIATAHGQFPENLVAQKHRTSGALALVMYEIETGRLDPKADDNRPYPRMHSRIGELLIEEYSNMEPLSAHQALLLIGAANARLRFIGQPLLTPEQCRKAAKASDEIPF